MACASQASLPSEETNLLTGPSTQECRLLGPLIKLAEQQKSRKLPLRPQTGQKFIL
jgi:hypothetical protein